MQIATDLVLLVHLIGFAALFGGALVQVRAKAPEVSAAMLHGALTQLLSGAALLVLALLAGDKLDWVPLGIKLALTALIVLLVTANRRWASIPRGLLFLIGGLTLANAVVGVLWQ